jgi:hypothetical protein
MLFSPQQYTIPFGGGAKTWRDWLMVNTTKCVQSPQNLGEATKEHYMHLGF